MAEEKKKFKINLFDIVIILIVFCVGAGLYIYTHRGKTVDTQKLTYVIEINQAVPGMENFIRKGDNLTENTKNYNMGKVVDFAVTPYRKVTPDYENNIYRDSIDSSSNTVLITVEANVTETASTLAVDGQFVIRAGSEIFVKGEGYAGEGYIVKINR
ncbi:hypothetical protein IMSAG049_01620 [Clostridiales bacterium]|nr:hypothetical protein IMSAG049_01620 [Clostridiales bacterium]